jgi:Protein of unknown function (DUF5672)
MNQVTLCCIDNQYPELGFDAIIRCTRHFHFKEVLFFTNSGFTPREHNILNLKIHAVDNICNLGTYSEFMIKELGQHIDSSHVLIVQWDGFITHPHLWQEKFLDYDYIGAPWPSKKGLLVGNGGFSLRSKKLLDALQDDAILAKHPEDQCICLENRAYLEKIHGIKFAPSEVAEKFAFELQKPTFDCFGFHGVCNFPHVLSIDNLFKLIHKLPPKLIFTEQFSQFIDTCQNLKSVEVMRELEKRIRELISNMDATVVSSRLYRHIIKIGIRRKIYGVAMDALYARAKVTGWNTDAIILLARIYAHKFAHFF